MLSSFESTSTVFLFQALHLQDLLGNGEIPSKEFVPFAAFILKKLGNL